MRISDWSSDVCSSDLFTNAEDIAWLGLRAGDRVDLESLCDDGVRRRARHFLLVEYDIPRGCLAAYYPATNALVPLSSFADHAPTPTPTSIPVVVTAHHDSEHVPAAAPRHIPLAVEVSAGRRRGPTTHRRANGRPCPRARQ